MGKGRIDRRIGGVLVGFLDAFQIGAQVIPFGGNKPQFSIDVDSRGVDDLVAGCPQDGVGDFAFGHRLTGNGQCVGGRDIPLGVRHTGPAFDEHALGRVDTGLHIIPRIFEHLLIGHIADTFPVHLHVEHKTKGQPVADNQNQSHRRRCGQKIGNGIPDNGIVFLDAAAEVLQLGRTDLAGVLFLQHIGQFPDMPQPRSHPGKGAGQVLHKGQNSQHKGPCNEQQQVAHRGCNGMNHHTQFAPGTNPRILDPKAD